MRNASALDPKPASSASGVAPRASARSSVGVPSMTALAENYVGLPMD